MAQVKPVKINAAGFEEELGSGDDLTLNSFTAALAGGLNVTSGTSITNNITFNAVTDTIAGIENQNLLDKTATETISADWSVATGYNLTLVDAPTAGTDAANKDYVDSVAQGLHWQEPVLDIQVDNTLDPGASPATGARYILTDVGNLNANFGTITGVGNGDIVEYDGASFVIAWDASVEGEGGAAWVEDEDKVYVYNGTAWVTLGSTQQHNNLGGLQGGNGSTEYYHMTAAEDTWLNTVSTEVAAANVVDKTAAETISGNWTYTGENTYTSGVLNLPTAADGTSPVEGGVYWDGTLDALFVYDGSTYINVTNSGSADSVQTTYTAGAGGIAQYDAVYISADDTVLKADASAIATGKVIGFAPSAITAAASGAIQENGLLSGVLSGGGTAGDVYYLSETPGLITTTAPTTSGAVVYRVGIAKNANDLQLGLEFVTIRA